VFAEQVTQELFDTVKDLATEWKIGEETRPELWVQSLAITALPLKYARSRSAVIEQHCQELLEDLVLPGVQHPSAAVRREAINVVGLLCLLEIPQALAHTKILRAALQVDDPQVQSAAARALLDFALIRGPAIVDSYCLEPPSSDHVEEDPKSLVFTRPLLDVLEERLLTGSTLAPGEAGSVELDQDQPGTVIAEGLARLLMHATILPSSAGFERQDSVRILQKLLQAYSDASTDSCPYMRQCLAVFFDAYVSFSADHQQVLASTVVPLLQAALSAGKLRPAQALAAYVARLLQIPLRGQLSGHSGQDPRDALDQSGLAMRLTGEIMRSHNCPERKSYVVLLSKVASSLPLMGASETALRQVCGALDRTIAGLSGNAPASKELVALRESVVKMKEGVDEELDAVELEGLEKALLPEDEARAEDVAPSPEANGQAGKSRASGPEASGSKRPGRASRHSKAAETGAASEEGAGAEPLEHEEENTGPATPEEAPPKKRSAAKGGGKKRQTRATRAQKAVETENNENVEEGAEESQPARVSPPTKRATRSTRSSSRSLQAKN
jgi:hypothetical protein